METKEIWIKIVDFPDYSISSFGRVKSFKNYAKLKERILKPQISKKGYLRVILWKDGIVKVKEIHSLMIVFFNSNQFSKGYVIDHIDGNRKNNNLSNLRIVTHRENTSVCVRNRKNKSSKYVGVYFDAYGKAKNKWRARAQINGINYNLGRFYTEAEAFESYCTFIKRINHTDVTNDYIYSFTAKNTVEKNKYLALRKKESIATEFVELTK